MTMITLHLDIETEARLRAFAEHRGCRCEEIAAAAVAGTMDAIYKENPAGDPARDIARHDPLRLASEMA